MSSWPSCSVSMSVRAKSSVSSSPAGLIVSRDPVAADATGARIIQVKRNVFFGTEKPISPPALHIAAANTRFGLGNSRADQIQLVRLGWEEDILI